MTKKELEQKVAELEARILMLEAKRTLSWDWPQTYPSVPTFPKPPYIVTC